MQPIYLDYNATTPIDPAVREAMLPFLGEEFGNPSSAHAFGRSAHEAVEQARTQVGAILGASHESIVFTGGGSEASNLAIKGVAFARMLESGDRPHFVTSAIEHPATLRPLAFLQRLGCEVTAVRVNGAGLVDPDDVRAAITPRTALVSIMHSNNEVGTLQPIREIAAIARERGVLMHTDAAQSVGKVQVDVDELGADLLTVAGHKLYAPKGVGALFIRGGVRLEPLIHGAGHERGRRAGTENVASIVGLGAACRIARQSLPAATDRLCSLRERLHARLIEGLGNRIVLNGHPIERLPNTLNVSIADWTGSELLASIPDIAASTGSACHEGRIELSPVLAAMGVALECGRGAVRLSVGRITTDEEVDRAAECLVRRAREKSGCAE